jgi:DHA2 family methylenomycin A resistance protein-like MFS transporter
MTAAPIKGAGLGWSNRWIVPASAIATLPGLALVAIERRARSPRLPLLLFSNSIFSLICYIFMSGAATCFGMVFELSPYLQKLAGYTPLQTGIALLPLSVFRAGRQRASAKLMQRIGAAAGQPVLGGFANEARNRCPGVRVACARTAMRAPE